jgi:hypothetical protein
MKYSISTAAVSAIALIAVMFPQAEKDAPVSTSPLCNSYDLPASNLTQTLCAADVM